MCFRHLKLIDASVFYFLCVTGFRYGALTDEPICYCATKFVGSETGCATERHGADNPNEGYKRNVIYEKADSS